MSELLVSSLVESHIYLYKYISEEHLDELPVVDLAVPVAVRGADHLVHLLVTQVLAQVHQHLPGGGYQP